MTNTTTLPTLYQEFIHQTRYARWIEELNRRETWEETVNRYIEHMINHLHTAHGISKDMALYDKVRQYILELKVMPSMRALMTSGPALTRDNIAGFNCSYMPINHPRCFDEMVYILMCGSGVGFSVERQEVNELPTIPKELYNAGIEIKVEDSKLGWARAIKQLVAMLYAGEIPDFNTSAVRKAGERLKTFGGRASGPGPLIELYQFMVETFIKAAGRKLTSIECHDICCKIGDVVVSGGVRRSALLSLSNLSDERMRDAKSGQWWETTPWRRLSNNSVAYTEKPDVGRWMREWTSIYESKSGERGVFNRQAVIDKCESINRDVYDQNNNPISFGSNPCVEIILRPFQFCNLTEVVCREDDTEESLKEKITIAVFLGTYQSTLTDYKYIRDIWKQNSEEERLLGVSLTGIMDCKLINTYRNRKERNETLEILRDHTVVQNRFYAKLFGINESAAITCVKPSGTVSQLTDSASGIHARHSDRYIRAVRNDTKDPITKFMLDQGITGEPDIMNPNNVVFSFPIESPKDCITRNDMSAIEQLENWLDFKIHWCHHNPSVTITVKDNEWPSVGAWVYEHFDQVAGISFLPHSDHVYQQAPYQDASKEKIDKLIDITPKSIDWELNIEVNDSTTGTQTLACTGNTCEIA
jgi:ribonucleoside-diphosphate reductase alpha chain